MKNHNSILTSPRIVQFDSLSSKDSFTGFVTDLSILLGKKVCYLDISFSIDFENVKLTKDNVSVGVSYKFADVPFEEIFCKQIRFADIYLAVIYIGRRPTTKAISKLINDWIAFPKKRHIIYG